MIDQGFLRVEKPRAAIVINLDELRELMNTYVAERGGADDLLPRLLLSDFLEWVRLQQKSTDDEINARR